MLDALDQRGLLGSMYRATMLGLAMVIAFGFVTGLMAMARSPWAAQFAFGNGDLSGYLDGARRFLATGSPYLPEQVAGSWHLQPHSFIHPPVALVLFVPFLWLPAILWWAIPIVGTTWIMIRSRPAPWTWPLVALCLAWPRSQGSILDGNTDLWAMFAVALGVRYGWPFIFLIVKPTFAPLAILGTNDRRIWIAAAIAAAATLPLVSLWLDYFAVIRNTDLGLGYSVLNMPLIVMPLASLFPSRRQERAVGAVDIVQSG